MVIFNSYVKLPEGSSPIWVPVEFLLQCIALFAGLPGGRRWMSRRLLSRCDGAQTTFLALRRCCGNIPWGSVVNLWRWIQSLNIPDLTDLPNFQWSALDILDILDAGASKWLVSSRCASLGSFINSCRELGRAFQNFLFLSAISGYMDFQSWSRSLTASRLGPLWVPLWEPLQTLHDPERSNDSRQLLKIRGGSVLPLGS